MTLPQSVTDFFTALNDTDASRAASLFAADAVVVDDGQTFRGTDEIRDWARVHHDGVTAEVTGSASAQAGIDVLATISGDFPGSPLDFDFRFTGTDDLARIERLTIAVRS